MLLGYWEIVLFHHLLYKVELYLKSFDDMVAYSARSKVTIK